MSNQQDEQDETFRGGELPRLREQLGDRDPDMAHAARLVASARVRETSDEQADRVWRRLGAAGVTTAPARRWRSPASALAMRPVFAAFALIGMASLAFAGVTYGRRLIAEWRAGHQPAAAAAGDATLRADRATGHVTGRARGEAVSAAAPSSPEAPAAEVATGQPSSASPSVGAPSSAPVPLLHPRAHGPLPDPAVAVNNALDRESETIKDAVRALRRDQDYERARMYLEYYLRHYPEGLFFEEALALSAEAAQKAGDRAEAASLARRYLGRYPDGRYRANAAQLIARVGKPVANAPHGSNGQKVRP